MSTISTISKSESIRMKERFNWNSLIKSYPYYIDYRSEDGREFAVSIVDKKPTGNKARDMIGLMFRALAGVAGDQITDEVWKLQVYCDNGEVVDPALQEHSQPLKDEVKTALREVPCSYVEEVYWSEKANALVAHVFVLVASKRTA